MLFRVFPDLDPAWPAASFMTLSRVQPGKVDNQYCLPVNRVPLTLVPLGQPPKGGVDLRQHAYGVTAFSIIVKYLLDYPHVTAILKHMLKQSSELDQIFHALSDPTRRAVLDRLTQGPASVSELAAPFETTLAAIVQHVQVLEASGLIATEKIGRTRMCRISPEAVARAERWLSERRALWEDRFDRLGALLEGRTEAAPEKKITKRRTSS